LLKGARTGRNDRYSADQYFSVVHFDGQSAAGADPGAGPERTFPPFATSKTLKWHGHPRLFAATSKASLATVTSVKYLTAHFACGQIRLDAYHRPSGGLMTMPGTRSPSSSKANLTALHGSERAALVCDRKFGFFRCSRTRSGGQRRQRDQAQYQLPPSRLHLRL
jgi:hypothetical protein